VAAINAAQQALEFIVRDRLLIFRQRFPRGRIGDWVAEAIGCNRRMEEKTEEEGEVEAAKDHGLDFGLFNTMVGGC
jgi:hypothetical protein